MAGAGISALEKIKNVAKDEMAKTEAELLWRLRCVLCTIESELCKFDLYESILNEDIEIATVLMRVFGTPVDNKIWNKVCEYWYLWDKNIIKKIFKEEKEEEIFKVEGNNRKKLIIFRVYCEGNVYYYRLMFINKKGKKKEYYLFYYPYSPEIFS